jgi:hypothetical protein
LPWENGVEGSVAARTTALFASRDGGNYPTSAGKVKTLNVSVSVRGSGFLENTQGKGITFDPQVPELSKAGEDACNAKEEK